MEINPIDKIYSSTLSNIITLGTEIKTRNSICTRIFNHNLTFTQTPLVSLRKTAWKNALREMEWFLSGSNNINNLHPRVRKWWEPWADKGGYINNNYSQQLRGLWPNYPAMEPFDQVEYLLDGITNHPYSRRNVITTWNTADMAAKETPITNCHGTVIQCFVEPDNKLHMTMYQRSSDMVLGWQHNLIQYWALLMYLANHAGRDVGSFTWIGGDCHIYQEHYQVAQQLSKSYYNLPTPNLVYAPLSDEFKADDFTLDKEYQPLMTTPIKMIV